MFVVHEGNVRGGAGWRLSGVAMSACTWSLKLLKEATRSTHVLLSNAMVLAGAVFGGGLATSDP